MFKLEARYERGPRPDRDVELCDDTKYEKIWVEGTCRHDPLEPGTEGDAGAVWIMVFLEKYHRSEKTVFPAVFTTRRAGMWSAHNLVMHEHMECIDLVRVNSLDANAALVALTKHVDDANMRLEFTDY